MMGHHPEMNGSLTSPGVYPGLHISPQMSAAAAAAYGRSPMVRLPVFIFFDYIYILKGLQKLVVLVPVFFLCYTHTPTPPVPLII